MGLLQETMKWIGGYYGQITIKVEISQFYVVKMQVLAKIK